MPVEYRATSQFWYGRWTVKGHRKCKRLKVAVTGKPGSEAFEQSREKAEKALAEFLAKLGERNRSEDLVQSLHEIKFGSRIGSIPVGQLAAEWLALPRKATPTAGRVRYGTTVLKRFVTFIRSHYHEAEELAAITPTMAEAFMAAEDKRGIAGRSFNAELALLRSTFERLRVRAGMLTNPFSQGLISKEENSVPRKPFTMEEVERLLQTAKPIDPEIHDLITVGVCTALRRGDACCLKWEDIDLEARRIRILTRKTGGKVTIPIFPRLYTVLAARSRGPRYVFPGLAASYESEPWVINTRLNTVFKRAGLAVGKDEEEPPEPPVLDVEVPDDDNLRKVVMAKLQKLTTDTVSPKIKATMLEVFDLYSSGATVADITKQLDISKGSVSNYLTRIEKVAGHPIIRREIKQVKEAIATAGPGDPAPERRDGKGKIRVNNRGFHALRATFTTQALAAGVPVEVVKLITGHTLTETVLKHYFNPDEQTVFAKMQRAMPQLLTQHSGKTLRETMIEEIKKAKLPKKKHEALLALAERIST